MNGSRHTALMKDALQMEDPYNCS